MRTNYPAGQARTAAGPCERRTLIYGRGCAFLLAWPAGGFLGGYPAGSRVAAVDSWQSYPAAGLETMRARGEVRSDADPLVLRDVEGLSNENEEVAEALEVSLAAAKSRIHRGRMHLREELAQWECAQTEH